MLADTVTDRFERAFVLIGMKSNMYSMRVPASVSYKASVTGATSLAMRTGPW